MNNDPAYQVFMELRKNQALLSELKWATFYSSTIVHQNYQSYLERMVQSLTYELREKYGIIPPRYPQLMDLVAEAANRQWQAMTWSETDIEDLCGECLFVGTADLWSIHGNLPPEADLSE